MIEKMLEQFLGLRDTATTSKKLHTLAKLAADLTEAYTNGTLPASEYTELMANINVTKLVVTNAEDIKTKQELAELVSKAVKFVTILARIPRP